MMGDGFWPEPPPPPLVCRCGGKGWVPRFPGDRYGDLCLPCADPEVVRLATTVRPLDRVMPARDTGRRSSWRKGNPVVRPDLDVRGAMPARRRTRHHAGKLLKPGS